MSPKVTEWSSTILVKSKIVLATDIVEAHKVWIDQIIQNTMMYLILRSFSQRYKLSMKN